MKSDVLIIETKISRGQRLVDPRATGRFFLPLKPDGTPFNIQNAIPHQSPKAKAVPETSRAKEFQRGTSGAAESAKEGARVLPEGSDTLLGCGDRTFESCHSDHNCILILLQWVSKLECSYSLQSSCDVGGSPFRAKSNSRSGISSWSAVSFWRASCPSVLWAIVLLWGNR